MLLSLMDDPNRLAVQGKVVWLTPEGVQGNRTQGIGVQFTQDETGAAARATIEKILGETLASTRPTHTMYRDQVVRRLSHCRCSTFPGACRVRRHRLAAAPADSPMSRTATRLPESRELPA